MSRPALPPGIWALGAVSLLTDLSTELIHVLLPVYLVVVLGASALQLGLIEGAAEATASIVKVFSGWLSDRLGRRKPLTLFGYAVAMLTKPIFPLAGSVGWFAAARCLDRVGKGIRGAPRDALIADLTPAAQRGAAFGLRQSLDTTGAFLAPILAIVLMWASGDDYRLVFWVAVIPAVLAVVVLAVGVHEPPRPIAAEVERQGVRLSELRQLGRPFAAAMAFTLMIALARFGEAFLVLRASTAGLAPTWVPVVLMVMNLVYALSAYPAGLMADRIGRRGLLFGSIGALIVADLVLAVADPIWAVLVGVGFWGLHMGLSQGLLTAWVADVVPPGLRGTAFGVFHLTVGIGALLGNVAAGALWHMAGPTALFLAAATLALLALPIGWRLARVGPVVAAPLERTPR